MKINEPVRLPGDGLPPHFWRHLISVGISILACVALDIVTIEYVKPKVVASPTPITIYWQSSEVSTNASSAIPLSVPTPNSRVMLGFGSDGKLYYRAIASTNQ